MKLKLFLLSVLAFCTLGFSQKKSVAITSFETTSSNISIKYVKAIEDKVKEAFYATNRFDIVDRTNLDKLKAEKELQKTEDFIDGKTVQQSSLEGAEQIVTGSISQVDIVKRVSESSVNYECKISFSLQVIDIVTGQVLASKLIRPKQGFVESFGSSLIGDNNTPDKAFFNSLKGTQKAIDKFVNKHFPVTTLIIEITEISSNKAKLILVNTGKLNGTKKNQKFSIIELINKEVNGKKLVRKKELGEIKITKVEGDEISEAKVLKGGEAILTKFNSGAKIECHLKH
ncbi:CsgG/HfaB family protein [Winogradskyella sp.]|uniref:CsgG/HfaB family protein n=1 Tax=Winogradskyella sp. TaxID=1883156 RepID=UPI0026310E17|nr:CsgG/HfaB family protein [Winogradskyella sp.]